MKGSPAIPGWLVEEYADVARHDLVFGHVGFSALFDRLHAKAE